MRVLAVLMLGFLVAACRFEPSGQTPGDPVDARLGEDDGREPDDGMPPVDGPPWWNMDFKVRVRIAIDNPPTDEELRDVPVLVVLDQTRIDYGRAAADGRDLRFVAENGNELPYEIERWDPAGSSYIWVRVPAIASGASTYFWLYHDNPGASAPGAQEVWSDDYLAVWHLAEEAEDEGSNAVHRDATGNGNDGAQKGNELAGATGLRAIGGAQAFDGDDDSIDIPEQGLQETGTELTLLARVYVDGEPNEFSIALGSGKGADLQWQIAWQRTTNTWVGRMLTETTFAISNGSMPAELYTWYLLAVVYDGTAVRLYVDGEPLSTNALVTGNLEPLRSPLYIGNDPEEASTALDGIVDEVRIARVAHSASWLRVQHASMNDALLDFGTAQCMGGC